MKDFVIRCIRKVRPLAFLDPEGEKGIQIRGHRDYIGGHWEEIGSLQFDFLLARGLKPDSFLLDIACGSLRLGVKAIPFLEPEHYLGIEKESGLVAAGFENELDKGVRATKHPHIVISSSFEFEKIGRKADFAIAQSLFSHLPPPLINLCFKNLHPWLADNGVFYASYFEVETPRKNPDRPHDHGYFAYTKSEMVQFGVANGFEAKYIGHWDHPRDQVMVEYRRA
ncbi:MAG TPA: class I SAM-dependent methyltransferase [Halioglobus sp.]